MTNPEDHISVCICTCQRPQLLKRLLEKLAVQKTEGLFAFSILVVDNDVHGSAQQTVAAFAHTAAIETRYLIEPVRNIALTRNKLIRNTSGNYLAWIDDDEFPQEDWLLTLWKACRTYGAAGVLGPVLPHFESAPPQWLSKGGFYERARHHTGFILDWQEARTGNVLLRREILNDQEDVFDPKFGMGGEDQDFFRRMMGAGHTFIWCDEAPVYETVPPHRWKLRFLLQRALMRGKISSGHRKHRITNLIKSCIAVPLYALALPVLLILGQHHFIKYLIRLFDHLGRLLAGIHLNPVSQRLN